MCPAGHTTPGLGLNGKVPSLSSDNVAVERFRTNGGKTAEDATASLVSARGLSRKTQSFHQALS